MTPCVEARKRVQALTPVDLFPVPHGVKDDGLSLALQIDGGSEVKAGFEAACQAAGILLFVLPPRSPKLNGHVERAHRTYQEEFYDLVELPESLAEHNALLRQHEELYNNVRPHQALGFLAPNEYLHQFYSR